MANSSKMSLRITNRNEEKRNENTLRFALLLHFVRRCKNDFQSHCSERIKLLWISGVGGNQIGDIPDRTAVKAVFLADLAADGGYDNRTAGVLYHFLIDKGLLQHLTGNPLCGTDASHTGVHIRTMCLSGHRKFPLGSRDPAVRLRSMDVMQRAIALSAQAGISLIQLAGYDVYYEEHGEDTREYFCDGLAQAVELAAAAGVSMGFETMETPFMDTVEKSMVYVRQIRSPYLGIYPDIGNLQNAACLYGREAVHDLRTGAGHIFAAHLKETAPGIYRDMQFGTTGHTKYVPCIRELWRQGVRIYTGECWYHGEENYRDRLQSASAFLRSKITEARQTIESKEK